MVQAAMNNKEEDEYDDDESGDYEKTYILILGRSQRLHGKFERLGIMNLYNDSAADFFDNTTNTTVTIV